MQPLHGDECVLGGVMDKDQLNELERVERFKKQQKRIVRDFEHDKDYFAWLRLPDWKKYEGDHINGIDDGEEPGKPHEYPSDFNLEIY